MGPRNKAVALLMAVVLACTTLFATTASAQQVSTSLAASPMATMSAIDDIGTPLSNQAAAEVRGEQYYQIGVRVLDWAGRLVFVGQAVKWFFSQPSYSTCVYSITANSTPLYCY